MFQEEEIAYAKIRGERKFSRAGVQRMGEAFVPYPRGNGFSAGKWLGQVFVLEALSSQCEERFGGGRTGCRQVG